MYNSKKIHISPYFGPFLLYLSVLSRKHGISDKKFLMLNGLFLSFCRICNTSSKHYPSKHKQINTFTLPKHLHSFRLLFGITSIWYVLWNFLCNRNAFAFPYLYNKMYAKMEVSFIRAYTIELSVTLASLIEPTSHIEIYHLKRYRSGESRIWFEMCIIMCVDVNLYSIGFSVLFFSLC